MKIKNYVLALMLLPVATFAQKADTLVKKLDSLEKKTDSVGKQDNNIKPQAYNEVTKITPPIYFKLLKSNFKQQFMAPFTTSWKGWQKFAAFGALTGAVALSDKPVQQKALDIRQSSNTVRTISNFVTNTGGVYEVITLSAFGTYGFLFKNEKMKTTTFLASQAYITSAVMSTIFKELSGRQRPSYYDPNRVEADPKFKGPFANVGRDESGKKLNSSFPSGHTALAFSAATVYAMEYRNRPLVPILSYTAASLIGLSRITENKHWTTDVLVGAALGHLCGRQVVNNYHRYQKLQTEEQVPKSRKSRRNRVSLNLNYVDGRILPGAALSLN